MRLFLALRPSPPSLFQLLEWQRDHRRNSPRCRVILEQNLHMTLLFEGDADEEKCRRLEKTGEDLVGLLGAHILILDHPRLFLDARSVRGLGMVSFSEDSDSAALWKRVGDFLQDRSTQKKFWPHITLFRHYFPSKQSPVPLSGIPSFSFSELVLYRSTLHPGGSAYRALKRWDLAFSDSPLPPFPDRHPAGRPSSPRTPREKTWTARLFVQEMSHSSRGIHSE